MSNEINKQVAIDNQVVKVFVGCDPNNCDLEQMMVLDYSLNKYATVPVEIIWMQLSNDPNSFWYSNPKKQEGWNTSKWATPFSGFRWAIPEYCDFKNRAIYMDADMIVLSDISELWEHPIESTAVVAAKTKDDITRLCTCVWDNSKAKAQIASVEELRADADSHKKLMEKFKQQPQLIQPYTDSYNCIDGEDLAIDNIKILHYSDMGTQFSHKYSIPRVNNEGASHWFDGKVMPHPRKELADLFDKYFNDALEAGYDIENYRVDPFGEFPKKTHKRYKGNKITRPFKSKSLKGSISKLFNR